MGWLGQSLYLREACGREEGAPPPVDLAVERRNGDFVRSRILAGEVDACHDLSDGGLLIGLAEMVGLASNDLSKYPHEVSAGMKQRMVLARALAAKLRLA